MPFLRSRSEVILGEPSILCFIDFFVRCSNYNNGISKSGAMRLFQLLLPFVAEEKQSTAAEDIFFTPSSSSVPSQTHSTSSNTPLVNRSTVEISTSSSPSRTKVSYNSEINETPRKEKRQKSLKNSRLRNSGINTILRSLSSRAKFSFTIILVRATQMAIQMNWTDSTPNFQQINLFEKS